MELIAILQALINFIQRFVTLSFRRFIKCNHCLKKKGKNQGIGFRTNGDLGLKCEFGRDFSHVKIS